jgi:hypothetical protein
MKTEPVPSEPQKVSDMTMVLPKALDPWRGLGSSLVVEGTLDYRDWTIRGYSLATDPETRIVKVYDEQLQLRNSLTSSTQRFSELIEYAKKSIDARIRGQDEELSHRDSASRPVGVRQYDDDSAFV